MTSATYRQSSAVTPENYARDPYNRLLARGPRFRVDAEIVRDIALESERPVEFAARRPERLSRRRRSSSSCRRPATARKSGRKRHGADRYRRAPTRFVTARSPILPCRPSMRPTATFPACGVRARTRRCRRSPRLNEPLFLECARGPGTEDRSAKGGTTTGQQLNYAFRRCLSLADVAGRTCDPVGPLRQRARRSTRCGRVRTTIRTRARLLSARGTRDGPPVLLPDTVTTVGRTWPDGRPCHASSSIWTRRLPRNSVRMFGRFNKSGLIR